jgi:glycosyltransferase involved in cell wall biosynthesis
MRHSSPGSESEAGAALAVAGDLSAPGFSVAVSGKFLSVDGQRLWVRGATYGTFRPGADGTDYPDRLVVDRDFAAMAAAGFNTLRVYTVPPRWLLDAAATHRLRVMVGVPWEQHVAFLDERGRAASIEARVREGVRACAGHPAILCYALGNEIPAPVVRWHGRRRVERFLGRLADAARAEDPRALLTYVNYPTTEYLEVAWADVATFNVYLEEPDRLAAYIARLQNLAGDRPLLLAEIGLDSRRHGEAEQARALEQQVRLAFGAGCAGTFVFAWTDEWHRGGHEVEDWDFGLTDRARRPKPALHAVSRALKEVPFPPTLAWPRVSVVVCSYNGARTIGQCLESLAALQYPDYEVIVVNDGSTDATRDIASQHRVRLMSTPNRGLSAARNTGLALATGEIVAYIDDDAYADPYWLTYLASTFLTTDHVGVGGPNVPPAGDGDLALAVAASPGGPVHVLLSDREAEHLPGCNMAFRKSALAAIGGFDPRFRTAGDDVDVCWRLRDRGWTLGFNAAALVWHHRRGSIRAYWRQQVGYGRAEGLLERKFPDRYNAAGHPSWAGRLYGPGASLVSRLRGRIYQGTWGTAPFQSLYARAPGLLASLPAMPEWYLVVALLALFSAVGTLWPPLGRLSLLVLLVAAGAPFVHAARAALRVDLREPPRRTLVDRVRLRLVIAWLHVVQPAARLRGRLEHGLTVWRRRGVSVFVPPVPRRYTLWTETWRAPQTILAGLEASLRTAGFVVGRGGDWDRWDLEVRGGLLGRARLVMAVEEHGHGRQLFRFRVWPRYSRVAMAGTLALAVLAIGAAIDGAPTVAVALLATAAGVVTRGVLEGGHAIAAFLLGHHRMKRDLASAAPARAVGRVTRRVRMPSSRWPEAQPTDAQSA